MIYPFGREFTHVFYPTIDDEPENLPTQSPSIYLFTDENKPGTVAAMQAGTNATGSEITTWTEATQSPYGRTITVPAVDDPEVDSSENARGYWLAINYVAETGGTTHSILQYIEIARIRPTDGVPGTTKEEVKEIYPAITSYISNAELDEFLETSEEEMRLDYEKLGYDWTRIFNLPRTHLALAYKTIANAAASQIQAPEDKHHIRFELYEKKYSDMLMKPGVSYDSDNDNAPDKDIRANDTYGIFYR